VREAAKLAQAEMRSRPAREQAEQAANAAKAAALAALEARKDQADLIGEVPSAADVVIAQVAAQAALTQFMTNHSA
jgi:glutathione S-transferase